MITEANLYDVMALTKQIDRDAVKFNAFSMALSSVRDPMDSSSIADFRRSEQSEFDRHFRSLATLLGYTVTKTGEEAADPTAQALRKAIDRFDAANAHARQGIMQESGHE